MMAPKISTIKRLFAVSGNQCAYPRCDIPLVELSGTVTGQIAHIKADSENGPRYDVTQTDEERHGFDNLILLCGRHHTIIDTEIEQHPVTLLQKFKKEHEQSGLIEIMPQTSSIAQSLLQNYQNIVISNNSGPVAVNSPGAIQANTINLKTTKQKVTFTPPDGAVASNLKMLSYIEYLIAKYNDYQKQDKTKIGKYKYMAIYVAIKREFNSNWKLIPESHFEELVGFLMKRIDNTMIGRIKKKRGQKRYHSFSEHMGQI